MRSAIVMTAWVFCSCVALSTMSLLAYQTTKSSSSILLRMCLDLQKESGSFLLWSLPIGISLTVMLNPSDNASRAFFITALMPVP